MLIYVSQCLVPLKHIEMLLLMFHCWSECWAGFIYQPSTALLWLYQLLKTFAHVVTACWDLVALCCCDVKFRVESQWILIWVAELGGQNKPSRRCGSCEVCPYLRIRTVVELLLSAIRSPPWPCASQTCRPHTSGCSLAWCPCGWFYISCGGSPDPARPANTLRQADRYFYWKPTHSF